MFEIEAITKVIAQLSPYFSLLTPIVAGVFTWYYKRSQEQQANVEYIRSVRLGWMHIDEIALSDSQLLLTFHRILNPGSPDLTDALRRREWATYMILNVVFLDFLGAKAGLKHKSTLDNVKSTLRVIVSQDDLFYITQSNYSEEFHKLAKSLRDQILKSNGNNYTIKEVTNTSPSI